MQRFSFLLLLTILFSCKKEDVQLVSSDNFLINGGGRGYEFLRDMDIDSDGNIYATGKIGRDFQSDTAWFHPLITKAISAEDILTVKYNKYGKAIWANVLSSTGWDEGEAIAAGPDGHCYVAGVFGGPIQFGSTQIKPEVSFNSSNMPNLMDMFLTRLDAQGKVVWTRQITGAGYERPTAIDLDPSGNILVTGYFHRQINFGGTSFTTNGSSFFIVKYSQNGNLLWAKTYGDASSGDMYPDDIVVGGNGNITIGGSFSGLQNFGGTNLQSQAQDNFVAKYNENGNLLWAKKIGGSGSEVGRGVALDELGNTYFGGMFQSTVTENGFTIQSYGSHDAYWAKYNSTGELLWLKSAGGIGEDGVNDLIVYKDTLYSTGYFIQNFNISGQNITERPLWNGFLTKHDLQGNFGNLQVFSFDTGLPLAIQIGKSGYGTIGGYFSNTITSGNLSKASNGSFDWFLMRQKF